MAIEKVKEGVCNIGTLFMKINEIIDYINSQDHIVEHNKMVAQETSKFGNTENTTATLRDDLKGLAFRDAEVDQIMDVVKKHQGVEQEPNKAELVPLDAEQVMKDICNHGTRRDLGEQSDYEIMEKILSKYGVPKQKKFTEEDIDRFIEKSYGGNMIGKASIMWFLSNNDLFEK